MPKQSSRSRTSRKRSAAEALEANVVQFPPAISDFVVHYRSTAYCVLKFVLSYHSSDFRTYIEQQTDGQRAYPKTECAAHSIIDHRIRLPDSCGKVKANSGEFQRLLAHLYFAHYYCTIPSKVAADVDLTAERPCKCRKVEGDDRQIDGWMRPVLSCCCGRRSSLG